MSRLRTLGALALAGATAATAVAVGPGGSATAAPSPGKAKNVILLIGDGMGRTHVTAGRNRFYGGAGRLTMERAPVVGQVATFAVEEDSNTPELVTDSASSATAWSSGVKTYNAALGVDAYGRRVDTFMEQAKRAGLRTGNVSTAEITDATPAGMASHVLLRGCQGPDFSEAACLEGRDRPDDPTLITPVAEQMARNGTADVILGGGLSRFEPEDARAFRQQGYTVLGDFGDPALDVQTAATQRPATKQKLAGVHGPDKKLVALFNRGNLTIERSKRQAPAGSPLKDEPRLADMTQKALQLLTATSAPSKGFFLQVEGALIDKRSHANDAAQVLDEIKAFDDAVAIAYEFARQDGNTLVVVTADHECAGFSIVEPGTFTNAEATSLPTNADTGNPASGLKNVLVSATSLTTSVINSVLSVLGTGSPCAATDNRDSGVLTVAAGTTAGTKTVSLTVSDNAAPTNNTRTQTASVTVDNTTPDPVMFETINKTGGTAGRAETGDTIVFTFDEPVDPHALYPGWDGSGSQTVFGYFVQQGNNDRLQIFRQSGATYPQVPLTLTTAGSTNYVLLSRNYVGANVAFSGSTMTVSGNEVRIVLGTPDLPAQVLTDTGTTSTVWYTSSSLFDYAGNALTPTTITEAVGADTEF